MENCWSQESGAKKKYLISAPQPMGGNSSCHHKPYLSLCVSPFSKKTLCYLTSPHLHLIKQVYLLAANESWCGLAVFIHVLTKTGHSTGSLVPYSLQTVRGFLNVPWQPYNTDDTGDGVYGLCPLSEKTRMSNHLQRNDILLGYV